jgi:hypothetical protein
VGNSKNIGNNAFLESILHLNGKEIHELNYNEFDTFLKVGINKILDHLLFMDHGKEMQDQLVINIH